MTPPLKVPPSTRTEKRTQATPERARPMPIVLCAKNWRFLSRAIYINAKIKMYEEKLLVSGGSARREKRGEVKKSATVMQRANFPRRSLKKT